MVLVCDVEKLMEKQTKRDLDGKESSWLNSAIYRAALKGPTDPVPLQNGQRIWSAATAVFIS